jgi:hypothetical protein
MAQSGVTTGPSIIPVSGQTIWEFNPSLPGLLPSNAGLSIYVKNEAFVIPASQSTSVSLVQFQGLGTLPAGLDVWVCGYADINGQTITAQDGSTAPKQSLTMTNACYKMFNNDTFVSPTLLIQNADTVRNGNAHVTEIKLLIH